MHKAFKIGMAVLPEMLQNPPPQFARMGLLYTPLTIRLAGVPYPRLGWCDFTGPLLLRWHREVQRLIAHESRYARLIFCDSPREVWLRRTNGPWWKASGVARQGKNKTIEAEVLCLPERVEAELHAASQWLLDVARKADVWTEDAAALDAFLRGQIVSSGTSP